MEYFCSSRYWFSWSFLNAMGFDYNFTQQSGDLDKWMFNGNSHMQESIQPAYYQAAEIDGATRLFRHIELPKMKKNYCNKDG